MRGRKGGTYEGGIRVPGIFRFPGHIAPGSISDEAASTIDIFPTAIAVAGVSDPTIASKLPLDGKNILPLLIGRNQKSPHQLLLFFDSIYLHTARAGKWKLHVARWNIPRYTAASAQQKSVLIANPELYDMTTDAGEGYDLAADKQDVVMNIQAQIASALRSFPAEIQEANAALLKLGKL
ncbi:MAG: sulfatase-like hydrolase/transferase [Pyrinomonadaceae bacterium]|nr:sulfatase-like hydrolase/transferase [Pyrinomonadaceae bacterium]